MKTTISKIILSGLLLFSLYSCDKLSCETDNAIFLNNEILSKTYQREVVHQIELVGQDKLRFWLADYIEKDNKHYLVFYTQGNGLCAQAVMHIDHNNKRFNDILNTKGKGLFNAEFRGVSFDISQDDNNNFLLYYTGHESIID
ncbi:hypothetical protein [Psychroserpens damuponensis]|uniref:hypothetical protein n=1 Tax=Psychroserpens damuponensis TaxID=943936 RepID=UPI00058B116C|nr:hypothetical protein [Psychroserpens damuponensis]